MDPKEELVEPLQDAVSEETAEAFDLEDIMKEFSADGEQAPDEAEARQTEEPEAAPQGEAAAEVSGDTLRVELPVKTAQTPVDGDTLRFALPEEAPEEEPERRQIPPLPEKAEPFSEGWEPEYEQPMGEYVPPQPILFKPRSRLRELKRKLVAGPEKRYYDLSEQGFGKLQAAIFFCVLLVLLSAGTTVLYTVGLVPENRMKLLVFGQFLAMLLAALLGCQQMIEGVAELLKGRFTLNTMLLVTFAACGADGILGLRDLRMPCCAAFSLHVVMALWAAYHRRQTEMAQMDTMRRATRLDSIVRVPDYYDGCAGLLRSQGQVEDFMDHYAAASGPEKVLSWYSLAAVVLSLGISVAAGVLHHDPAFAVRVLCVSLLACVPVTGFIAMTRPMAILEKRLHKLGTVLCGWQGVRDMCRRSVFPVDYEDLFPAGSCKMNGVKFYGSRDPDQVVAYSAALIQADGSGLGSLFDQLLSSRNGRHYTAMNYRIYENGGIGGEVCTEPVLMGSLSFLKEMGVEVPKGISVSHAVYTAVDGELCGVFAITYGKAASAAAGIGTLCAYRGLRPVLTECDFMLTESFIKDRFGVNPRRICFPDRQTRQGLKEKTPPLEAPALALVTTQGLAPFAYAVTGSRSLRTVSVLGAVIHLLGGIVGLAIMVALAVLGEAELLTPVNLLAYELIWMVPGLLITEWTRLV